MLLRIILYLALLFIGGMLSYKNLVHDKIFNKITCIQMFFLYMLIFIMGIRLGMNEKVIKSLNDIGVKSLVFAVSTIIFSVVSVFFVSKIIIKDSSIEGRNQ